MKGINIFKVIAFSIALLSCNKAIMVGESDSLSDISKPNRVNEIIVFDLKNSEYKFLKEFEELKSLTIRNSSNLLLEDLLGVLEKNSELEYLDVSGNNIESLPKNIMHLENLRVLRLGNNSFKSFPDSLKMPNLEKLIFSQYPEDFRSWSEYEKLKLLELLPNTEIILEDYFGGTHGNFRLGKKYIRVDKNNLY
jgi:Leucine-rich repeat (LRR) protein